MDDPKNTSTSLVEFFAVVGTKYPAKHDSTYQVHPPTFYYPIINLTVILTKDSVPKNFILLEKTVKPTFKSLKLLTISWPINLVPPMIKIFKFYSYH